MSSHGCCCTPSSAGKRWSIEEQRVWGRPGDMAVKKKLKNTIQVHLMSVVKEEAEPWLGNRSTHLTICYPNSDEAVAAFTHQSTP